jgi:hypothetical protein
MPQIYSTADHSGFAFFRGIVFDVSITGMVGSNPSRAWMNVGLYSVFMLSRVGRGIALGQSPIPGVLTAIGRIHNIRS